MSLVLSTWVAVTGATAGVSFAIAVFVIHRGGGGRRRWATPVVLGALSAATLALSFYRNCEGNFTAIRITAVTSAAATAFAALTWRWRSQHGQATIAATVATITLMVLGVFVVVIVIRFVRGIDVGYVCVATGDAVMRFGP